MTDERIDTPDPLVNLRAIEKRIARRRTTYGGAQVLHLANHVALSLNTLSLSKGGQLLTAVTMSPLGGTLAVLGGTLQLTATATDQKGLPLTVQPPIGWSSSNPAVATVGAAGLVTAQTNGVATIQAFVIGKPTFNVSNAVTVNTALATTNHVTVSPKTLSVAHTVVSNTVPQSLAVVPNGATVQMGGSLTLAPTITNAQGQTLSGYTATWDSSNTAVATVSASGVVTPVALGTATISGAVIDQGYSLQYYAGLKNVNTGLSVNWHYQGENPYQGLYPKNYADIAGGGLATEEVASNIFHVLTGWSAGGGVTTSSGDVTILDNQVTKIIGNGSLPVLYWLNGDVSNGEPSWYATTITAGNAQAVLYAVVDWVTARYKGRIHSYVLFNELIKTFGNPGGYQTNTFWTLLGDSYTTGFFALAANRMKLGDPAAEIWVNNNHCETDGGSDTTNWANLLAFLTGIVTNNPGVLTGFRFEMHQNGSLGTGTYTKLTSRIKSLLALGLKYGIGEFDMVDDTSLAAGPAGINARDQLNGQIRTAVWNACVASGTLPDHWMDWQDSAQTSWTNSPPEATGTNGGPGSVYDRQQHTTDGDKFVIGGVTYWVHQRVPATGLAGQTASGNVLSVMVTPRIGSPIAANTAATYTKGLTGGTIAQTGGIVTNGIQPAGYVLSLTATTLTGTAMEGTHGRPNVRDESYVATPAYRAQLANFGGPVGSTLITVVAAPAFHEPTGMTTVINTGDLTVAPSQQTSGSWQNGTCVFGMASTSLAGDGTTLHQDYTGRLTLASVSYTTPDTHAVHAGIAGPGYRLHYPQCLGGGGWAPVRFGSNSFAAQGTGRIYWRCQIRTDPAYTTNGNVTTKFVFLRSSHSSENHFFGGWNIPGNTNWNFTSGLQIPASTYQGSPAAAADCSGGAWHLCEAVWDGRGTAGTATGTIQAWVDGVQVINASGVTFFNTGDTPSFSSLWWDPTYGGGQNAPPANGTYVDFNQMYVSVS